MTRLETFIDAAFAFATFYFGHDGRFRVLRCPHIGEPVVVGADLERHAQNGRTSACYISIQNRNCGGNSEVVDRALRRAMVKCAEGG
jgi:hypothetical protein